MLQELEKRIFDRIDKELTVRYSPAGTDREFCSVTKNISGGGVRINLLKKHLPGTILDLEIFNRALDISIRCQGQIVWLWETPMDEKNNLFFDAGIKFLEQELLCLGKILN